MTTTVVKTIGNGTRDYTSIQAWNDACPANLVTNDQIWEGHLYPEGPGTDGEWVSGNDININGSTTDATRFKRLRAAPGHSFMEHANKLTNALTYNTANGVAIRRINNYSSGALTLGSAYTQLVGVQLAYNDNRYGLLVQGTGCSSRNCLLMGGSGGGAVSGGEIYNSVIFSSLSGMYSIFGVSTAVGCTFISLSGSGNAAYGQYGGSVIFKDCALFNYAAGGSVNSASSYNATNFASLPGTNNQLNLTTANQFENTSWAWGSTTMDARAKAGNGLQFGITDAALDGFDILGQTRATPPTIGAYEYISTGGITATQGIATASGANATVNLQQAISAAQAVANATGLLASTANTLAISASLATANAIGLAADINRKIEIAASPATGVSSAFSAGVNLSLNVAAEIAQATASGQSASIATAGVLNIAATQAAATALGLTGNVNRQSAIQSVFGAAVADGYSANVDRQFAIATTATNCVASGLAAGIDRQLAIDAIVANCVASGLTANISFSGAVEIVASVAQAIASGFTASISLGSFSGSLPDADINRIVVALMEAMNATPPNVNAITGTWPTTTEIYDATLGKVLP